MFTRSLCATGRPWRGPTTSPLASDASAYYEQVATAQFAAAAIAGRLTDVELVSFIIEGRPASHELNTTGVDMLPRGGNADFTDQDLFDIVAYLRTL